jgi:NifB/MoaA-like Fe-S oxidoreductase
VNDGVELERTLDDMLSLYPELASVALVPVGVSAFSVEEAMRPHTSAEARQVVALAQRYQVLTAEVLGRVTVFASDEFYLVAGLTPPPAAAFESLDQAENGIGLVAAFVESFVEQTEMAKLGSGFFQSVDGAPAWGYRAPRGGDPTPQHGDEVVVVTGEYAAPILRALFDRHGYDDVAVLAVQNAYFGGNIKVAGLLTGRDLAAALAEVPLSTVCLVPDVCLSEGRFLDGLGLEDLAHRVITVPTTGRDLRLSLDRVRSVGLVHS